MDFTELIEMERALQKKYNAGKVTMSLPNGITIKITPDPTAEEKEIVNEIYERCIVKKVLSESEFCPCNDCTGRALGSLVDLKSFLTNMNVRIKDKQSVLYFLSRSIISGINQFTSYTDVNKPEKNVRPYRAGMNVLCNYILDRLNDINIVGKKPERYPLRRMGEEEVATMEEQMAAAEKQIAVKERQAAMGGREIERKSLPELLKNKEDIHVIDEWLLNNGFMELSGDKYHPYNWLAPNRNEELGITSVVNNANVDITEEDKTRKFSVRYQVGALGLILFQFGKLRLPNNKYDGHKIARAILGYYNLDVNASNIKGFADDKKTRPILSQYSDYYKGLTEKLKTPVSKTGG
ncbi:MAG: hypothetical protein ACLQQ4_17955 [Bacteroidia bacterium]